MRALQVLARPAWSARNNPYTSRIYDAMPAHVEVTEWSLARAALGQWDVLHVHWPETVFDHTAAEAVVATEALLLAVDRARARGARLVWTIHNLRAHGRRHVKLEDRFRARFFERLDGIIALTDAGLEAARSLYPELETIPARVVAHPHYRGVYLDSLTRDQARQTLGLPSNSRVFVFVGRIAAYKGLESLVSAFGELTGPVDRLVIAGAPVTAEDRQAMQRWAMADSRIVVVPGFVPEDKLQRYLRAANVVVLPFKDILNSGSAILSLSFDRPVLAPARGAIVELARQAGAGWVRTYDGALTADKLAAAVEAAVDLPERTAGEMVGALDPSAVAAATAEAYRALV